MVANKSTHKRLAGGTAAGGSADVQEEEEKSIKNISLTSEPVAHPVHISIVLGRQPTQPTPLSCFFPSIFLL